MMFPMVSVTISPLRVQSHRCPTVAISDELVIPLAIFSATAFVVLSTYVGVALVGYGELATEKYSVREELS